MGHSRKRLELTGQQFGKLTVIATAENIAGRTAWLCRCQCGRERVVKTYHLRNGHVTSCGCNPCGLSSLTFVDGTYLEMLQAKTIRKNNTSGVPGVEWCASKQRWRVAICFKGKRHYLGSYTRFEDAVTARRRAEEDIHDGFVDVLTAALKRANHLTEESACGGDLSSDLDQVPSCRRRT